MYEQKNKTIKQILTIQPCLITEADIKELYEKNAYADRVHNMIPRWIVHPNTGKIIPAKEVLGRITPVILGNEMENSKPYYVFDIHSTDPYLEYEVREGGFEWIMGLTDMDWREALPTNAVEYSDRLKTMVPEVLRIVIEINYSITYYEGIPEGDMEIGFDRILEL